MEGEKQPIGLSAVLGMEARPVLWEEEGHNALLLPNQMAGMSRGSVC
jgi:hypothetical protein